MKWKGEKEPQYLRMVTITFSSTSLATLVTSLAIHSRMTTYPALVQKLHSFKSVTPVENSLDSMFRNLRCQLIGWSGSEGIYLQKIVKWIINNHYIVSKFCIQTTAFSLHEALQVVNPTVLSDINSLPFLCSIIIVIVIRTKGITCITT